MSFRKSTRITFKSANTDGSHSYVLDYDLPDGNHRSLVATVSKRYLDDSGNDEPTTELEDDVPARAMLIKVLENFDLAGHCLMKMMMMMMIEDASTAGQTPSTKPAPMRPVHMQYMAKNSEGNHRYLVLMSLKNGQQKKYVFTVSELSGKEVICPAEFLSDIGGGTELARPLIDALRTLYIACSTEPW